MKVQRIIGTSILVLLLLSGLLSIPFLPGIEASLTTPPYLSKSRGTIHRFPTVSSMVRPASGMPTATAMTAAIVAQDTFQRANRLFWGTASDGQRWGGDANARPEFMIAGNAGQIVQGSGIYNATLGPALTDAEVVFSGSLSRFHHSNLGAVLRWNDQDNWYKAYIDGAQLVLLKDAAGIMTRLAAVPFPALASASYTLRFRVMGAHLMARVWLAGQVEPSIWMIDAADTPSLHRGATIVSGSGGLRLVLNGDATATITMFRESVITT